LLFSLFKDLLSLLWFEGDEFGERKTGEAEGEEEEDAREEGEELAASGRSEASGGLLWLRARGETLSDEERVGLGGVFSSSLRSSRNDNDKNLTLLNQPILEGDEEEKVGSVEVPPDDEETEDSNNLDRA